MPGGTPGGTDVLPLPANPLGDGNGNGLSDLIDYAMGNSPSVPPSPATITVQPPVNGAPQTYLVSYPIALGADRAEIKVLFSTNLIDWEDGTTVLTPVSTQPLGDGRAMVTWKVDSAYSDAPRLFMRLQIISQ